MISRFGYSRGSYDFTGYSPVAVPGWVEGKPIGAIVISGSTASNGASQVTLAGTNVGSNNVTARNLFTGDDQSYYSRGNHQLEAGGWVQRIQSDDLLAQDQYGQASFSTLKTFLQGTVELRAGFRSESSDGWNESRGRASNYALVNGVLQTNPVIGDSALTTNRAKFLLNPRVGCARQREDRGARRIRDLSRAAGHAGLPAGSDGAVQHGGIDQKHCGGKSAHHAGNAAARGRAGVAEQCAAGHRDADGADVEPAFGAAGGAAHVADGGICRVAQLPSDSFRGHERAGAAVSCGWIGVLSGRIEECEYAAGEFDVVGVTGRGAVQRAAGGSAARSGARVSGARRLHLVSPTAGVVTATSTTSRQIQFGAKLLF